MINTAELRKQGFRPYRKIGVTYAKKMNTSFTVRIDNGEILYGQPGDYACINPEDSSRWIVNAAIFDQTYRPDPINTIKIRMGTVQHKLLLQGFKPYHKHQVTWAKKLPIPMVVHTLEGDVQAHAGDYLCVGINGEQWPQPATRFEKNYERVHHAEH
jgi:hypothetical protein